MAYLLFLTRLYYIIFTLAVILGLICRPIQVSLLPYGKMNQVTQLNARNTIEKFFRNMVVSKSLFYQFYICGIIYTYFITTDLVILRNGSNGYFAKFVRYIEGNESDNQAVIIPAYTKQPVEQCIIGLLMISMQVTRRAYECLFVDRTLANSKMHILHYIVGITFYLPTCLSTFIEGIGNLGVYGGGKDKNTFTFPPLTNFLTWNILLGVSLFLYAFYHQFIAHKILASLRPKSSPPGIYSIPKGDWFDYVSSAHYFAEILIYISFIILNKGQILTNYTVAIWTALVLGVSAKNSDLWGIERFGEKWPNRWKIFPGVY
ncbi:6289_t:CDS:2 [Diversispora eburnea]|uniref:6289_t:CDS:1 n=1 Tax=Diversispora eburnea TaxID=1213867 RepID=A0A9N8V0E0_9GLOM|nr:6289_t:CDS:2 [Diversispora eburnea]